MRVAVTGANGFVGTSLVYAMRGLGYTVIPVVRLPKVNAERQIADSLDSTEWRNSLDGADAVVHLIGRAHHTDGDDAPEEYRRDNAGVTAALLGGMGNIRRFVYLSSVKAVAEDSGDRPLNDTSEERPTTVYGRSKLEAEELVGEWAGQTGANAIVLRPPLVYGPGAKGNLASLVRLADSPIPLPVRGIRNLRSLIALQNLIGAILAALNSDHRGFERYLIADEAPLSTDLVVRSLREGMGRPNRTFALPSSAFSAALIAAGKRDALRKLTGSLVIDASRARHDLKWSPRIATGPGLVELGRWHRSSASTDPR